MNLRNPIALDTSNGNGSGSTATQSTPTQNNGTTSNGVTKPKTAPIFLTAREVETLIRFAPNPVARLCMNLQWRAGLTVDEILTIKQSHLHLNANPPELKVQPDNDDNGRVIPVHQHLALSLLNAVLTWNKLDDSPLIDATPQQVRSWYEEAMERCHESGAVPMGTLCDLDTLRHSSATHWLQNGIPINIVSKWLGHPDLSATLIYAELISDSGSYMERVP